MKHVRTDLEGQGMQSTLDAIFQWIKLNREKVSLLEHKYEC